MKNAALKARAPARITRAPLITCPAEACLREYGAEMRRWKKFMSKGHQPWGTDETTGKSFDSPEFRAHCDLIHEIEARATRVLATSQVGAAYQALMLYGGTPDGSDMTPPLKLNKSQQHVINEHDDKVCRLTLSLYLRLRVNDPDLLLREKQLTGPDSLQEVVTEAGFNLLPVAA